MKRKVITRTVWWLSVVSLLTDMATEMLYPVMPVYLKQIGFSVLWIGILEGMAEAMAGWSKGYFGHWSDRTGRRLPFVQTGYALSALSKPLTAVWAQPVWALIMRMADRLGKGLRTGPRDAMLAAASAAEFRPVVFGFHRSLDTFGAVLGPLLAMAFLYAYPGQYRWLFAAAAIPGLLAVGATLMLREQKTVGEGSLSSSHPGLTAFVRYWRMASPAYKRLSIGLLFFALFNSSDMLLLLALKESGLSDQAVIAYYIWYNLIYALAAYPVGILARQTGMRHVLVSGFVLFSATYAGMATRSEAGAYYLLLFALYGGYAACTEGISRAWLSRLCDASDTATAIGSLMAFQSLAALVASAMAGAIWLAAGPAWTFGLTAVAGFLTAVYIFFAMKE